MKKNSYWILIVFILCLSLVGCENKGNDDSYGVTFDSNGGTNVINQTILEYVTEPKDPTKDGYTFLGWYIDDVKYDFSTKVTSDITLVVKWELTQPESYIVTFDSNGGTNVINQTILDYAIEPKDPTKDGYTFLGWYIDDVKYDFSTKVTSDITLVAKWELIQLESYTVSFDSNGGTDVTAQVVEKNEKASKSADPTRTGYTFVGWYLCDEAWIFIEYSVTEDITLKAKWEANTVSYTVNYYQENIDDEEYTLKDTVSYDGTTDSAVTADLITYTGFTSPQSQTTVVKYDGSSVVNYYYTRNSYTVSFVTNGGNTIENKEYKYGSKIVEEPIRNEYTFNKWYSDVDQTVELDSVTNNVTAYAHWLEEDNATDYTYSFENDTCTITKYKGSKTIAVIPTYIGGYEVTSIQSYAFYNCGSLISITTPDGVTSIGGSAFYNCINLTSITLPFIGNTIDGTTNTHFGYIFGASSYFDNFSYVPINLKEVVITKATTIEYGAFYNCSSLTSITLPFIGNTINGTTNTHFGYIFGASSYSDNSSYVPTSLKKVVITKATSIGNSAFYNCSSLISITLPDSVTSIESWAFYNCSSLTSITLPDSVTSIGRWAFQKCSSLTSMTLPFIGDTINGTINVHFGYIFGADRPDYNSAVVPTSLKEVVITKAISIGTFAFSECYSLTSITLLDGFTSIGTGAFYNCSGLTSITLPDSVTSIGSSAFSSCSGLTSITLPDSVTSIGSYAFYDCSSLKIYCEVTSQPSGWDSTWNSSNRPVVWGYIG